MTIEQILNNRDDFQVLSNTNIGRATKLIYNCLADGTLWEIYTTYKGHGFEEIESRFLHQVKQHMVITYVRI